MTEITVGNNILKIDENGSIYRQIAHDLRILVNDPNLTRDLLDEIVRLRKIEKYYNELLEEQRENSWLNYER